MKKTIFICGVCCLLGMTAVAQTAREDIAADPCRAGGVYYAYPETEHRYTPAPKGYKPFYISHFGRHGSRWLLQQSEYDDLLRIMTGARDAGVLTPFGEDLAERVQRACDEAATHAARR